MKLRSEPIDSFDLVAEHPWNKCGSVLTVVGPNGETRLAHIQCGKCLRCQHRKMENYYRMISGLLEVIAGPIIFVKPKPPRPSSDLPQGYAYICVSGTIICNRQFKKHKATPRNKRRFVDKELRGLLESGPPGPRKKWVTFSRTLRRVVQEKATHSKDPQGHPEVKEKSNWLAIMPGDRVFEYRKLKTDEERAKWIRSCSFVKIFKKGQEFIDQVIPDSVGKKEALHENRTVSLSAENLRDADPVV